MNGEIALPEKSGEIIAQILERHGLKKNQDEGIEKFCDSFFDKNIGSKEKNELWESLPGGKIAEIVKEYAEEKLSLEKIPNRIKDDLNINLKDAEKIAEDIKINLLDLIKKTEPPKISGGAEKQNITATNLKSEIKPPRSRAEKKANALGGDDYREPIE